MTPMLAAAFAVFTLLPAEPADPPKEPIRVADLAWISGQWQGTMKGDLLHEEWSAPAGGAMMGSFRWIKEGRVQMYELLVLEDGPQGPVLFFRHFNPGLIGWEEKDAPIRCPLTGGGAREAVFVCEGGATRMTFRSPQAETLTVLLERQREGQTRSDEFVYARRR